MTTCACDTEAAAITIVRGNNYPPVKWQFLISENPDVIFPLDGSIFKLRVTWPGDAIDVASDDASSALVIDLALSIVSWNYTVDDSRSLPLGNLGRYALERWLGAAQQVLISGDVIGAGGDNPD